MAIRAVLFDLDGTLLDRETSLVSFLRAQRMRHAAWLSDITEVEYVARFLALDAHGYVPKQHVYTQIAAELGLPERSSACLCSDYEQHFRDHCMPYPGMHEMLVALTTAGMRLAIVTNGRTTFQRANIASLGLPTYVATILVSEQEGVRKPDPEIFNWALVRLQVGPHEAVFVGDHPVNDIAAARYTGMRTIWKRTPWWGDAAADASIDELGELQSRIS